MKKLLLLLLLIPNISYSFSLTFDSYLEFKKTSRGEYLMEYYIGGIGEGFLWYSSYSSALGGKPIYCVPPTLVLNAKNFMDILEREYYKNPNEYKNDPVGSTLIMGLRATFPCK
jgi:hypothetical protein